MKDNNLLVLNTSQNLPLTNLLSVVSVSGILLSVRHIKYGIGAERGYKAGYAIGEAEAESGKPMNQNFLTKYFPEEYRFGTTEFKGYAVYWPEGYKNGYQSVSVLVAENNDSDLGSAYEVVTNPRAVITPRSSTGSFSGTLTGEYVNYDTHQAKSVTIVQLLMARS